MFRRAPSSVDQNATNTPAQDTKAAEAVKQSQQVKLEDNNQDITTEAKKFAPQENTSYGAQPRRNLEIPSTAAAARRPMTSPVQQQPAPQQQGFQMQQTNNNAIGGFNSNSSSANIGHNSQNADAKRLVIGEGISISGDIDSCDYLVVEGSVKSDFKGSNRIDISKTGEFTGAIETQEADVAGNFEGTLIVNGRLTVRSTGKISGTIYYKELAVDSGAVIDGQINAIDENSTKTLSKSSSSDAKKKNISSGKKSEDDAANQQSLLATG